MIDPLKGSVTSIPVIRKVKNGGKDLIFNYSFIILDYHSPRSYMKKEVEKRVCYKESVILKKIYDKNN